jgi:hypothetical protein
MRRPPLTDKVKRGLSMLAELGRCWREADENQTLTRDEASECDAALRFIERGGLACKAEGARYRAEGSAE